MSHQRGASGIHQVNTDSNLVPVLGLRPLTVPQGQPPPAQGLQPFVVFWGLRESSVGFFRLKQIENGLCGGRALHRNGGVCQVRGGWGRNGPHPTTTQFRLSLCISDILSDSVQISFRIIQEREQQGPRLPVASRFLCRV